MSTPRCHDESVGQDALGRVPRDGCDLCEHSPIPDERLPLEMRSRTLTRSLVAATPLPVAMMPVGSSIGTAVSGQVSAVHAEAAASDDAALVTALDQVLANSALTGST